MAISHGKIFNIFPVLSVSV